MQSILDAITEWIKEILIGAINGNLSTMFGDVNEKVGTIAAEVGQTPQGWNAGIFNMIRTLSENVIVPIAGLVITYVLCVELISMVTEKNNMHDVDTFMFSSGFSRRGWRCTLSPTPLILLWQSLTLRSTSFPARQG